MNFQLQESIEELKKLAGKVGVLMGGNNAERKISLKSGMAVCEALIGYGIDAEAIDWDGGSLAIFDSKKFDSFFIALHGRGGEDGSIQAILDIKHTPYTGSGVLASALGMDKRKAKIIWEAAGLLTPTYISVVDTSLEVIRSLGFPLVIKPSREGSSIGITLVDAESDILDAIQLARSYDSEIMAEQYIEGAEYTVSIVGDTVLPVIKIETESRFYDYDAKYNSDSTRYICPSDLNKRENDEISDIALDAFSAIGCVGWGRVDFIRDETGNFQLIELNTVPGMTDHSLVPMSAKVAGIDFDRLVMEILAHGLKMRSRT